MAQLRRMVSDRFRTLPENSHASCGVSCAPSKHTISHLASPAILERVVAGISANRRESDLKEIDALARHDAELDLTALQVPTLVIVGEDDRVVAPKTVQQTTAHIPSARFEMVERAGHLVHVQRPQHFSDLVYSFLRRL